MTRSAYPIFDALPLSPPPNPNPNPGELVEWNEVDFVPFDSICGRSEATLERRALSGALDVDAPSRSAASLLGGGAASGAFDSPDAEEKRSDARNSKLWPDINAGDVVSVTQGKPNIVLDLCMTGTEYAVIEAAREEIAVRTESGCFIIGVARALRARAVVPSAAAPPSESGGGGSGSGRSSPLPPRSQTTDALAPCAWEWVGLVSMKVRVYFILFTADTFRANPAHDFDIGTVSIEAGRRSRRHRRGRQGTRTRRRRQARLERAGRSRRGKVSFILF